MDAYVMLGPPNSGKGTQAACLAEHLSLCHLSSGHAFRAAIESDSKLGRLVKSSLESGNLVPDDLVIELMLQSLQDLAGEGIGAILDGFPRTLNQAEALNVNLPLLDMRIRAVISIDVNEQELLRRARLRGRGDDVLEVVVKRIRVYGQSTLPLVEYYRGQGFLICVDGNSCVQSVTERILGRLGVVVN